MRSIATLVAFPLAAFLIALGAAAAQGQQKDNARQPVEIPPEGTELFRALLDRAGIKPLTRQEISLGRFERSDDIIVIVLGNSANRWIGNFDTLTHAHNVVNRGGAVLIASDTAFHLGSAGKAARGQDWAAIEYVRVECQEQQSIHDGKEFCPYVVPVEAGKFPGAPNEVSPAYKIFEGLTRVATNDPTYLRVQRFTGEWRFPLARYPQRAFYRDDFGVQWLLPRGALFAVGGDGPDGMGNDSSYQFLALADHSVFINQMLIEPGTENLELTYRVIEYLQGPGRARGDKRKRCIFIEDGYVIDKFDGLRQAFARYKPPLPIPNLGAIQDKLVDLGNAVAEDVQARNVPNNILLGLFGLPSIMRFVLLVVAVYATWFLLRKVFGGRKPTDIPPAPAVAGVPTGPPGVFDRRQKELLRRNNVYEPARDLLRDFFASVGAHGTTDPKLPGLSISPEVRKPQSLRMAIRDFWRLAYGPPQELTVNRWREMEPYFERLRQAHADGKWHFVEVSSAAAV